MAIILVRHGETALNAARVMQPADTPLSERGVAQAEAVGLRLRDHRVSGIVSSDLARAWQTAAAISRHSGVTVEPSALLHERNFGAWRGRAYDNLGFDPLAMDEAPPDGESAQTFAERIDSAFAAMLARHEADAGDLVVVTHGLLVRVLLARHLNVTAETLAGLHLGNTSVSIFAAEPPHAVVLLNCTRHLDGDATDRARSLSGG
jgi:probable phosphoglycerate mutase